MRGLRGIVVIAAEAEDIWEAPPKENWAFFMSGFSKKVVFVLGDLGDFAGMVDEKLPKREVVPEDDIVFVVSRVEWVGRETDKAATTTTTRVGAAVLVMVL